MYSSLTIAYAFVQKGIEENEPVTQMKLQKIIYFAHGYHLALYNKSLVKETFQAWKYGPVIPSIYQSFRLYGSTPIINTDLIFYPTKELDKEVFSLDFNAIESINYTWDLTKNLDAVALSNWTHKKDSPWYKFYTPDLNNEIPNEEIKNYFVTEFVEA